MKNQINHMWERLAIDSYKQGVDNKATMELLANLSKQTRDIVNQRISTKREVLLKEFDPMLGMTDAEWDRVEKGRLATEFDDIMNKSPIEQAMDTGFYGS